MAELSDADGPKVVARAVAEALGLAYNDDLPKDVLAAARPLMLEVDPPGDLAPKPALLVFARALAARQLEPEPEIAVSNGPPPLPWTEETVAGVPKAELVEFLVANCEDAWLGSQKLRGDAKATAKKAKVPALHAAYNQVIANPALLLSPAAKRAERVALAEAKAEADGVAAAAAAAKAEAARAAEAAAAAKAAEPKGFKKRITKAGNKSQYPKPGDGVRVMYRGSLEDGTVFETSRGWHSENGKKIEPLQFKVGKGNVIRGWDEALLEMSVGEEATVTIQPDWAYGSKPPTDKIPKDATLIFEVRLLAVI